MGQAGPVNGRDTAEVGHELPLWAVKLARRIAALPDGRYIIALTKDGRTHDLTVLSSGKVEHLG